MKRQGIAPSAPPEEAYYLPTLPTKPPPRWPPASSIPPKPVWRQSLSSQPPLPCWSPLPAELTPTSTKVSPPARNKSAPVVREFSDDVVDKQETQKTPSERTSRFVVMLGKQRKKLNPQLHTERGCTDVVCCFLFLVFTAGWGVVATIGFLWGDGERLILPTDSFGRRCGGYQVNLYNFTDRPYLYYFDITKCISYSTALGGCQTPQMCVAHCPSKYFSYLQLQNPTISPTEFRDTIMSSLYCLDDVNKNAITSFGILRNYVQQQKCASYTVKSAPVLGRCVPEILIGAADTINNLQKGNASLDTLKTMFGDDGSIPPDKLVNDSERYIGEVVNSEGVITKIVHDLSKSWWQILTLVLAAGVFAFLWTVILRVLGGLMIWTSILCIIGVLGAGCAYSWFKWTKLVKAGAVDDYSFQPIFSVYFEMPTTWLVVAVIASAALLIVLLVLFFVQKRISIAVALIEESSKAVGHMMSTLLFPIFPFVLHLGVIALWGTIAIWLASSGVEACRRNDGSNTTCDCSTRTQDSTCVLLGLVREENTIFWLQVYNLFAFFWMMCFISALGDISLAGAFASYYWARNKPKDVPSFPVLRALGRALRYNMGSLAFGSLIIAVIKILRVLLEYLDKKLSTTKSTIIKVILSALKCCFWCLEVFFKFLTKNAFIMMAIYGKNFYTSAKESFLLLVRNCVRAAVVNQVAGILLFIGKALITLGMGVVAFFYFSGQWVVDGIPRVELYYYFVPIVLVLIGSYFVADLFFDVYEMAVDTTFICFLEDSEQNDGSPEKPYYMSKNLQRILDIKNEK
ncbi:Choline transporter protein 1 [Trichostrongylus colubriformis]|uniref:Choline transporter-like protein n=1 Tax=Trichostrongylus colubriformis TaxID=6319 RepID=A0AAN8IG54_TRICO